MNIENPKRRILIIIFWGTIDLAIYNEVLTKLPGTEVGRQVAGLGLFLLIGGVIWYSFGKSASTKEKRKLTSEKTYEELVNEEPPSPTLVEEKEKQGTTTMVTATTQIPEGFKAVGSADVIIHQEVRGRADVLLRDFVSKETVITSIQVQAQTQTQAQTEKKESTVPQ